MVSAPDALMLAVLALVTAPLTISDARFVPLPLRSIWPVLERPFAVMAALALSRPLPT